MSGINLLGIQNQHFDEELCVQKILRTKPIKKNKKYQKENMLAMVCIDEGVYSFCFFFYSIVCIRKLHSSYDQLNREPERERERKKGAIYLPFQSHLMVWQISFDIPFKFSRSDRIRKSLVLNEFWYRMSTINLPVASLQKEKKIIFLLI